MVEDAAKQPFIRDTPRPFMQHVVEFRQRLVWGLIPFPIGFILAFIFYEPIIKFLEAPAPGMLSLSSIPIVTSPTEFMGITIKLALIVGFALTSPVLVYQIILFVAPAVSRKTQRLMLIIVPAILLLF